MASTFKGDHKQQKEVSCKITQFWQKDFLQKVRNAVLHMCKSQSKWKKKIKGLNNVTIYDIMLKDGDLPNLSKVSLNMYFTVELYP